LVFGVQVGVDMLVAGFGSGERRWGRWIVLSTMKRRIDVRSSCVVVAHSGSVRKVVRPSLCDSVDNDDEARTRLLVSCREPCGLPSRYRSWRRCIRVRTREDVENSGVKADLYHFKKWCDEMCRLWGRPLLLRCFFDLGGMKPQGRRRSFRLNDG
jgi:hypothetical protein